MGPFRNAIEYYTFSEKYLELILDGQLFSAYLVKAYLIFKYLRQLAIPGRWNAFEEDLDNGPFFLKHMDDKGDHHILVDDDNNITGVIDWTFARVVPAFEAFGPSPLAADLDDLFTGKARRSPMDMVLTEALCGKGTPDIEPARMMNSRSCASFLFWSWDGYESIFDGSRSLIHEYHSNSDWYSSFSRHGFGGMV